MSKKKEKEVRQLLREAIALLDKKAPAIESIVKLVDALGTVFMKEVELRKHELLKNIKKRGADKDQLRLINAFFTHIIIKAMIRETIARIEMDRIFPK
jgi:hypothetical protein